MKPLWSWVCGVALVCVSVLCSIGLPPSEFKEKRSRLDDWLFEMLLPTMLLGLAAALSALGSALLGRLRGASRFGVVCLIAFHFAAFVADQVSLEGGWANTRVILILFWPFVLGLFATHRLNRGPRLRGYASEPEPVGQKNDGA
jgi:hypothetical protein